MKKNTHGGRRKGAGLKPKHTNPEVKVRTKKFRATDESWKRFQQLLPTDSEEAFDLLLELLDA